MDSSLSPFLVGVDVKVTGNEFVKDHTEYILLVSCQGKTWRVNRRYRQFDALHQHLRRDAPRVFLPPMPIKQWFGRLNPDFINQRQRDLQRFLDVSFRAGCCRGHRHVYEQGRSSGSMKWWDHLCLWSRLSLLCPSLTPPRPSGAAGQPADHVHALFPRLLGGEQEHQV